MKMIHETHEKHEEKMDVKMDCRGLIHQTRLWVARTGLDKSSPYDILGAPFSYVSGCRRGSHEELL
jgi:hypothetical protein